MHSNTVKNLVRVTVPLALAGTLLTVPVQAQAARNWTPVLDLHGAFAQVCKERAGDRWRVYVRVNNRSGRHWHSSTVGNYANRKHVSVRARAGQVSGVKSILTRRGFRVSMADRNNAFGGLLFMSDVERC